MRSAHDRLELGLGEVRRLPMMARNVIVAASASRLLPSTSAWLRVRDCNNAVALPGHVQSLGRDRAAAGAGFGGQREGERRGGRRLARRAVQHGHGSPRGLAALAALRAGNDGGQGARAPR